MRIKLEVKMWLDDLDYFMTETGVNGRPTKSQPHTEDSEKTPMHLLAMRMMRRFDKRHFAELSGIPFAVVNYFETTPDVMIPKYVVRVYGEFLKITRAEAKKIDEIVKGQRTTLDDEHRREIPADVRRKVMDRDKRRCTGCGNRHFLHYHHIQHFSKGGKHSVQNIKLLCIVCHAKEHRNDRSFHMLKSAALELMGVVV